MHEGYNPQLIVHKNTHMIQTFSRIDKLPPPPPYPGTSTSVDDRSSKVSVAPASGKVSLINVGITPTNPSSTASVITSSYITDGRNPTTKDIITGLSSRKLVINNNQMSVEKKDGIRKLSSATINNEEDVVGGTVTTAFQTPDGAKSIIINTSDAIMHTNNNKISIGSNISGVKYLLPMSPIQLSSSGKLEKSV